MIQPHLESFEPGYQILLLQPAGSLLISLFSPVIGLFKALTQISLSGTASCHIDPYVPLLSETQQSRCASSGFYNISSYDLNPISFSKDVTHLSQGSRITNLLILTFFGSTSACSLNIFPMLLLPLPKLYRFPCPLFLSYC